MKKTNPVAKVYSWVPGSRMGRDLDINAVGPEIERLVAVNRQKLSAEKVVESAVNLTSPLHNAFTWNDTEAAIKQRLSEAQHLLRSVQVTLSRPNRAEVTMRIVVTRERHHQPGKYYYSTTDYALSNTELRAEVLRQALRELAAFRHKYAELGELSQVFAVIDKMRR